MTFFKKKSYMILNNLYAELHFDGKKLMLYPNKFTSTDELFTELNIEKLDAHSEKISLILHPKKNLQLQKFVIEWDTHFDFSPKAFCNGYQSWSESRLFGFDEQPDALKWWARPLMLHYGDTQMDIQRELGVLHSWNFGYLKNSKSITFVGSLDESTAFTIIYFDKGRRKIRVEKEVNNLMLQHSFPLLDLFVSTVLTPSVSTFHSLPTNNFQDFLNPIFDKYFQFSKFKKLKTNKLETLIGWTSWYNYYQNISEEIILKNLQNFEKEAIPLSIFQIDDGWQTRVGDWLSIDYKKFPNGLTHLVQQIKNTGAKAGLWLSPFIVEAKSEIATNPHKKSWLLRGANGKPIRVGLAPHWSGWTQPFFYALDFYNAEVREYLTGVFYMILQKWGFDMLKLDFLYAVCVAPPPHLTRAQVMRDAMEFLRNLAGEKLLLGCGVPLASAFGEVDFCRIGADIHLSWEHNFLKIMGNRERVSTILALRTTLGRFQLSDRAFGNDPDVFMLRKQNNQLTETQRNTIFYVNILLGRVVFTSDDISTYDEATLQQYKEILNYKKVKIIGIDYRDFDFYVIYFEHEKVKKVAHVNLSDTPQYHLKAFETLIKELA